MVPPCALHPEKRRVGDKVNPPSPAHEPGRNKRWRKEHELATEHMTLSQLPSALLGEVYAYLDLPINHSALRLTCTGAVRAFDDGIANMICANAVQVVADGHWAPIGKSFPLERPSSPAVVHAVYVARPESFINALRIHRSFACSLIVLNATWITDAVLWRVRGDFVMECHQGLPYIPLTRWDYGVPESSSSLVTCEVLDKVGLLYPGKCRRSLGPAAGIAADISHLGDVDVALIALPRFGSHPTPTYRIITKLHAHTSPVKHVRCAAEYHGQPLEVITDADLQALAPYMPCLASLDTRQCRGAVTDTGLLAIASHCPDLTRLHVDGGGHHVTDVDYCCWERVTDVGIVAIASNCRQLTWLDVAGGDVTDDGLRTLAPLCVSLRYLNFSSCERVTDAGLEAIGTHCTRLEKLHIERASAGVTDAGIRSVVIGCANLALLDVSGTRCVTDATLHTVAEHCRNLTELQVRWNKTITIDGLNIVANRCTRLRRFDLSLGGSVEIIKLISLHPHINCVTRT
jgi:hypothetical protein